MPYGTHGSKLSGRQGTARLSLWVVALLAVSPSGCDFLDQLLSVDAPDRILADEYERPENAGTLIDGLIADFECAFGGYIVGAGLTGNELTVGGGPAVWRAYDQRRFEPAGVAGGGYALNDCEYFLSANWAIGTYRPLSVARWQADNVLKLLDGWSDAEVPNRANYIAVAAAYSGYSHLLLGEGMCEAAFDSGPRLTPPEIFSRAEDRFSRAIASANAAGPVADAVRYMALVGRARTRLNLGRVAEAADDARMVPRGFAMQATYSTASRRRENPVFVESRNDVALVRPPFLNLTTQGELDARVQVEDQDRLHPAARIPVLYQMKYTSRNSPIPIARWEEAQLILAESEVAAGNLAVAVEIINELRGAAALPPFESSDADEVMKQIIYERQAELFLESHHLNDLKRYGIPLDPPPGTPFHHGGVYDDHLCYPLPTIEITNNPNA